MPSGRHSRPWSTLTTRQGQRFEPPEPFDEVVGEGDDWRNVSLAKKRWPGILPNPVLALELANDEFDPSTVAVEAQQTRPRTGPAPCGPVAWLSGVDQSPLRSPADVD
jgi:hypothetical protein